MKAELQTHLNALKGYVDMKFDVLKGMMANDAPADEGGGEEYEKAMRESMMRMMD